MDVIRHEEVVTMANRLIDFSQRKAAGDELARLIADKNLPEIEKVHIISVVEAHVLMKCSIVKDVKGLLRFLCVLKEEIKTPHLVRFIKEYLHLEKDRLVVSDYARRKLADSDFTDSAVPGVNLLNQKENQRIRI